MTGEKDPRDVMQAEHDAGLSEHPAFRAPAEMPGVEEIARVLFEFATCTDIAKGPAALDANAGPFARAILALFAPILAEKDGYKEIVRQAAEARDAAGYIGAVWDCIDDLSARALAAEAALAAERERAEQLRATVRKAHVAMTMACALPGVASEYDFSEAIASTEATLARRAAAIRAQGE